MRKSVRYIVPVLVLLTAAAAPAPARADQRSQAETAAPIEVTPYVSLGSAMSSRVGAAIRMAWTSALSVELEVGYRDSEMKALSSHISLLYDLPRLGRAVPYVAAGIGLEQFGTALEVPAVGVVTQARTGLTVNAGGGVRVPVDDAWGIRADARWFNGIGRHAPERWRFFNGVTFRRAAR